MEKNQKFLTYLGVVIAVILIIVLIALIYPKIKKSSLTNATFANNIRELMNVGSAYFMNDLPKTINEKDQITLKELFALNLIGDLVDENNQSCSSKNSYVDITKTDAKDYVLTAHLDCSNISDKITKYLTVDNYIPILDNNSSQEESDLESSKPTVDNKDNNLSNYYYTVTFDSQGGTYIAPQVVKKGSQATYYATSKEGYRFLGWYSNNEPFSFTTKITGTLTLTAKWEKID